jgi:hypothetical protein
MISCPSTGAPNLQLINSTANQQADALLDCLAPVLCASVICLLFNSVVDPDPGPNKSPYLNFLVCLKAKDTSGISVF